MKAVSAPSRPPPSRVDLRSDRDWDARSAELFVEFEGPARAMVRRAYRGAFCDDELDDIYATAWVGTLRALEPRHHELTDDEVRSYLFTAVAHQAGREIRRRKRKPTAPLELVDSTPDLGIGPDEAALGAEHSRITRDVLTSLPPRRRAVMLLRFGWGLEPRQVCSLIKGLSPRAYRKEVTRGIEELTSRLQAMETGEWCADREPLLKQYAAGLGDADVERQARAHLAHCRDCSEFVAKLNGHLHDIGTAIVVPVAIDGIDGQLSIASSLGDRLGAGWMRLRDTLGGGTDTVEQTMSSVATSGGLRGASAGGAGVFGGALGLGGAAKVAVGCLTGAAATAACVTALVPGAHLPNLGGDDREARPVAERSAPEQQEAKLDRAAPPPTNPVLPSQVGNEAPPTAPATAPAQETELSAAGQETTPGQPAPVAAEPVPAQEAAESDFDFGDETARAPAAAPPVAPPAAEPSGSASSAGATAGGGESGSGGGDFAFGG